MPPSVAAVGADRSPLIASLLSVPSGPGSGQAYVPRPPARADFAIPPLVLVVVLVVGAAQGVVRFAINLLDPSLAMLVARPRRRPWRVADRRHRRRLSLLRLAR